MRYMVTIGRRGEVLEELEVEGTREEANATGAEAAGFYDGATFVVGGYDGIDVMCWRLQEMELSIERTLEEVQAA